MDKKVINLVPDDLVVRAVKYMRESGGQAMVAALTKSVGFSDWVMDVELARRMIVLNYLPDTILSERDRVWKRELVAAAKALMGVWSGRLMLEAVAARMAIYIGDLGGVPIKPEVVALYQQSLGKLDLPGSVIAKLKAFLAHDE